MTDDRDYKAIVDNALAWFMNNARWDNPDRSDIYSPGGVRYREEKAKSETWAAAAHYLKSLIMKEVINDVSVSESDNN